MESSKTRPGSNAVVFSSIFFSIAVCFVAMIHVEIELYAHRQMLRVLTQERDENLKLRQTARDKSPVIASSLRSDSGKARWLEYTPQLCGSSYRREIKRGGGVTLQECKKRCAGCDATEYWSGRRKVCFECLDHTKRQPFTNIHDVAYPPHVFVRQ